MKSESISEFRMGDRVKSKRISHKGYILHWDGPDAVLIRSEFNDQHCQDRSVLVKTLVRDYVVTRPNERGQIVATQGACR